MKTKPVIGLTIIFSIAIVVIIIFISSKREPHITPNILEPRKITPAPKKKALPEVEEYEEVRSKEVISPNGHFSTYIEPFEWEVVGNLYVKNNKTGKIKQLTDYSNTSSTTTKYATWLNDTLLLVIEGYTWGTCTVGGTLYIVDSRTGHHSTLIKPLSHQEVAEVSLQKDNVIVRIATWDTNRMNYKLSTRVISVERCLNSFANSN